MSRPAGTAADRAFAVEPRSLQAGDARLDWHVVPWDTATFGFGVADITRLELGTSAAAAEDLFAALEAALRDSGVRLASCRIDHRRLRESMALESHGFRFVELVYQPRRAQLDVVPPPAHRIEVRPATAADLDAVEAIAGAAFTTGRFVLDHRLLPELSDRRYAAWVRSSFAGTTQDVLVAELDGALVGFFIVEIRPEGRVYWHLTAIDPAWQGKGIGSSLWLTMLRRHAAEGATSVETTISAHNLAALNLYARLGFTFQGAALTLHRLLDEPG